MTADHAAVDSERAEDTGAAAPPAPARTSPGWFSRVRWLASPLLFVAVLTVLSVGLAAALYLAEQRVDDQTDNAAARSVVSAATRGTSAVLSYTPETLERDLAEAKSHLTGGFLDYYSKFSDEVLSPTAKQKQISSKATVVRAAVSELHPDSATVLVFVNQLSASRENPFVVTANSVVVSLTKNEGTWLISAFEPV